MTQENMTYLISGMAIGISIANVILVIIMKSQS